jgi:hypothetical protein
LEQPLRDLFDVGGAVVTDTTDREVVEFLGQLGWQIQAVQPDGRVGRHRRQAVELASVAGIDTVLHSDLDHLLRWLEAAPEELAGSLRAPQADLLVVGRSDAAMARSPARLRATEDPVNRIYALITGRPWDLLFAIRRLSADLAAAIVAQCREDSIASDLEWPLYAEQSGYRLAYLASDHLDYRAREDFDARSDEQDGDPALWIKRVEIANLHAAVLKRYLGIRGHGSDA